MGKNGFFAVLPKRCSLRSFSALMPYKLRYSIFLFMFNGVYIMNKLKMSALALAMMFSFGAYAGTLTLVNGSASDLSAIYISDSGTSSWEENLIPEGSVLPAGNYIDVDIQGSYNKFDLRIESTEGGYEDYFDFPGNASKITLKGGGQSEYQ